MIDYPATGTLFDLLDRHDIPWANYHHIAGRRIFLKRILGTPGLRGFRALRLAVANFFPAALKAGQGNLQFTADLYPLGIWRCLRHLRAYDLGILQPFDGIRRMFLQNHLAGRSDNTLEPHSHIGNRRFHNT